MKNDCFLSLFDEQIVLPLIPSPLNYTGGKYKLLNQILPCFPEEINVFWDIFCGGCNVGVNVSCNHAVMNDSNEQLITLLKTLQILDCDYTLQAITEIIDQFGLSRSDLHGYSYYLCDSSEGLAKYNKSGFLKLRQEYNKNLQMDSYASLLLFTLVIYSFNNQLRFNSDGKFNLPVGKRDFNTKMRQKLSSFIDRIQSDRYEFQCGEFDENIMGQLDVDDFVYADPPYLITCATYNEQNGWNENDEQRQAIKTAVLHQLSEEFTNASFGNIKDYTDNAIRYFRLTRYIYIRGGGYYIDLEPRRQYELNLLLEKYNGAARIWTSVNAYEDYLSCMDIDPLPWETESALKEIVKNLIEEVNLLQNQLRIPREDYYIEQSPENLKHQIATLRNQRTGLQQKLNKQNYASEEKIDTVIHVLQNIREQKGRASLLLEQYSALALTIINDALDVHPNYPVGDDNEPTFTAAANIPDIEYEYETFSGICEVTMLTGRDQWYNEGQPVQRHLRDYEKKKHSKQNYCVFISPHLHRDTINTFWLAVKYEYEGHKQKIIPLSISQLIDILTAVKQYKSSGKSFSHTQLKGLYDDILKIRKIKSGPDWIDYIRTTIASWINNLTN